MRFARVEKRSIKCEQIKLPDGAWEFIPVIFTAPPKRDLRFQIVSLFFTGMKPVRSPVGVSHCRPETAARRAAGSASSASCFPLCFGLTKPEPRQRPEVPVRGQPAVRCDAALRSGDSGDLRQGALLLAVISSPTVPVLSPSSFPLATQGRPPGEQTPLTLLTRAPSIEPVKISSAWRARCPGSVN